MARQPSKRWMEEVNTVAFWDSSERNKLVLADMAATLLSRQHARFVRTVKKIGQVTTAQFGHSNEAMAWRMACAEILAALQQGGKK